MAKRVLDIVVVSDVHLGRPQCRALELNRYLQSVKPKMLVLNGDIFDIIHHSPHYFPGDHIKVVRRILKMALKGTPVYYVTGNHDISLRQYTGFEMGVLRLVDRLELEQGGKRFLVVHGDAFDIVTGRLGGLIFKLGGWSYDLLMWLSNLVNRLRRLVGLKPTSLANAVKRRLPGAQRFIDRFVARASQQASDQGFDGLICGHIHQPAHRLVPVTGARTNILYLNSGDWVEHCTALEYVDGQWSIHTAIDHDPDADRVTDATDDADDDDIDDDAAGSLGAPSHRIHAA